MPLPTTYPLSVAAQSSKPLVRRRALRAAQFVPAFSSAPAVSAELKKMGCDSRTFGTLIELAADAAALRDRIPLDDPAHDGAARSAAALLKALGLTSDGRATVTITQRLVRPTDSPWEDF